MEYNNNNQKINFKEYAKTDIVNNLLEEFVFYA